MSETEQAVFRRRKRMIAGEVEAGRFTIHTVGVVCGKGPSSSSTTGRVDKKPRNTVVLQEAVESESQPRDPSTVVASPSSSPLSQTRKKKKKLTQMYLDLGQKSFHSTQCATCGFVYTPGKKGEERLHADHHAKEVGNRVIKFGKGAPAGFALVATDGKEGSIHVARSGGSGGKNKALEEVCRMLERELGMCEGWASAGVGEAGVTMYMYVNGGREMIGCVVVEVDAVKAVMGEVLGEGRVEKGRVGDGLQARRKQCAVRVMWASRLHRRKKVTSRLLDCVRGQLVPGQVVGRGDVAYSQPTADGALFIRGYSGNSCWVYE